LRVPAIKECHERIVWTVGAKAILAALALALRSDCPIFVSEEVLHAAKVLPNTAETQPTEQDVRKWLENLGDEDLGKYKM
jgi:hypothetical protein